MTQAARPGLGAEEPVAGWKTIAEHVALSASAARRMAWRRRDPLPVWRYLHVVIAFPSALRDWKGRQMLPLTVAARMEALENAEQAARQARQGPTRVDTGGHTPSRRSGK